MKNGVAVNKITARNLDRSNKPKIAEAKGHCADLSASEERAKVMKAKFLLAKVILSFCRCTSRTRPKALKKPFRKPLSRVACATAGQSDADRCELRGVTAQCELRGGHCAGIEAQHWPLHGGQLPRHAAH